ncbi:MAG TPA: sugar phosphate isomerase/epimerase [Ktedonobacterales bacterium]|jgi:sugar phosphate isomerase/epimerase|nr:sugar phosphate isomerase/epimerase [Ktedonobacterales bacterium]
MQVSLSTGTFYHRGLGYSLGLARDAGFDGVELALGLGYVLRGPEPYKQALQASDIPVLSVHPPFYPFPGWPMRVSKRMMHVTSAARKLDAQLAVAHVPFITGEQTPRAERFARAIRLGQRVGGTVPLTLENSQHNKREWRTLLDDLGELTRFALEHNCGVTFDTCHAGANGEDLLECYELVRPALRNVHLSDLIWKEGRPVTHVLPGDGELHLERFLAALARDGYNGFITMEIHPREVGLFGRNRHLERLRKAVTFVRTAIAQPAVESPSTWAQTPS